MFCGVFGTPRTLKELGQQKTAHLARKWLLSVFVVTD